MIITIVRLNLNIPHVTCEISLEIIKQNTFACVHLCWLVNYDLTKHGALS